MIALSRREFLRRALSLAPMAIVLPSVSYFLPPAGGWPRLLDFAYPPGDVRRYGVFLDGMTTGRTAWEAAYREAYEASIDRQILGSSLMRMDVERGFLVRVPPHEWHKLEVCKLEV